jgi:DNA-binding beta-propeller fold protein YncE
MFVSGLFGNVANAANETLELKLEATSDAALGNPHDLKLSPDGKYLFVSDVQNNRIAILDPETLALLGEFGSDHQAGTHDVDFDKDGNVYVADTHNNRVTIYRLKGLQATLTGELSDGIRGPEGVAVHPNGNVYVAGAWSGNLVAYRDGKIIAQLNGLSSPHDVSVTEQGDLWLSDAGNNRMLRLSPELKILQELSGSPFNFNGVRYQSVREDGSLIAADKNSHQVKAISADGKLLAVFGSGEPGKWPAGFKTPEGVETRGQRVWISDSGNDRVLRFSISR